MPIIDKIQSAKPDIKRKEISSFDEMLRHTTERYPFNKTFEVVSKDSIVVFHSSGSTGLPKPIRMTHGTFAVLDNERNLPRVHGRKNRDFSIWDFAGGGRFYTVFPYFHLAGFFSFIVNPIFTEVSSPVLGPSHIPPSGSLLKEVLKHQDLRAIYVPPSIAEQLLHESGGVDLVKNLDFICYTGGPFSPSAGKILAGATELCPLYGSTEAFQVPQLSPSRDDWAYMEWNSCFKLEMQPSDDDAYELVLYSDASTESMSALYHNLPGTRKWRTKDLFKPHPSKPNLWRYYGRRDDIIVLSNGEKFNPVSMKLTIQAHPLLADALVVGSGRSQAVLLVEPKAPTSDPLSLVQSIWSSVEQANALVPAQGRILRFRIQVADVQKPFIRAGKGTVVRRLTKQSYQSEIDKLYHDLKTQPTWSTPSLKPFYTLEAIQDFVRNTVQAFLPSGKFSDDDDLFWHGLDSVIVTEVCAVLKAGVQKYSKVMNLS